MTIHPGQSRFSARIDQGISPNVNLFHDLMSANDNSELLQQIRYLIGSGRFRQAVEYLNLSSPYRFTALYRISSDQLQNLLVYDRESDKTPVLETIPLGDSYCVFVRDLKDAFMVSDSQSDPRVEGHPKRPTVHSYCGAPLINMAGDVFGTICHFDFAPIPEDQLSLEALEMVAGIFDPCATSDLLERGVTAKVDALEAMLGLLVESCDDVAAAMMAFEEFARPIRTGVLQLEEPPRIATNARIDELLHSLPARFASKS